MTFARKLKRFWARYEAPVLIISSTSGLLVWAYSNFATATEMRDARSDLTVYVDQKHGDVQRQLDEIKGLLREQRDLSNKILFRVSGSSGP